MTESLGSFMWDAARVHIVAAAADGEQIVYLEMIGPTSIVSMQQLLAKPSILGEVTVGGETFALGSTYQTDHKRHVTPAGHQLVHAALWTPDTVNATYLIDRAGIALTATRVTGLQAQFDAHVNAATASVMPYKSEWTSLLWQEGQATFGTELVPVAGNEVPERFPSEKPMVALCRAWGVEVARVSQVSLDWADLIADMVRDGQVAI